MTDFRSAEAPQRWRLASRLFDEAAALEPGERTAFLDQRCGDDPKLRAEVESLLAEDRGEAGTAEKLLARALAIRLQALGDDHPVTRATRRELDELRQNQVGSP